MLPRTIAEVLPSLKCYLSTCYHHQVLPLYSSTCYHHHASVSTSTSPRTIAEVLPSLKCYLSTALHVTSIKCHHQQQKSLQLPMLPPSALFRATRTFPKTKTKFVDMYESCCMNELYAKNKITSSFSFNF